MDLMPGSLTCNQDGSVTIAHKAGEDGSHEMFLNYNECILEGSPLRVNAASIHEDQHISLFGPGLTYAYCGKCQEFSILTKLDKGDIDVSMDGPSPVDLKRRLVPGNDVIKYEYIAFCPGDYTIEVKYKNDPIKGSPFSVKVAGEGKKRCQIVVQEPSDLNLGIEMKQLKDVSAVLTLPNGTVESCFLKIIKGEYLGVTSFQPNMKGTYVLHLEEDSIPHHRSPIEIKISEREIGRASKVKAQGRLRQGMSGVWNDIKVDCSGAGFGELVVTIEGSHNTELRSRSDGKLYTIEYQPHEPGAYQMFILFADEPIPGAPFLLEIAGQPSGKMRTIIKKQIQSSIVTTANSKCNLMMALPGVTPLDLVANITCPSGLTDLCEIRDHPDSLYEITFTPIEAGLNVIGLKQRGIYVHGSPIQYTVGKSPCGGIHKIEVSGVGLERGYVGIKNYFNIYFREAGPGILSVAMDGPSKPEVVLLDNGTGFASVSYTAEETGTYRIGIMFDGFHISGSPFKVNLDRECKEARIVTVQGIKDRGADVERAITFQVSMNGCRGSLKVSGMSPTGGREEIQMQDAERDIYSCRFVPKDNGVYHVNVFYNGTHVTGSPFAVLVGRLGAEPALVKTRGNGLIKGEVGKKCCFDIVTVNCGSGPIHLTILGPSRVLINCTEIDYGYEYSYLPRCPGDYLITVKFCNVNIPGSPFLAKIIGYSSIRATDMNQSSTSVIMTVEKKQQANKSRYFIGDASKVVVSGLGLKKGFLGRSATFNVDLKDAGQGLLAVSMVSSNGKPVKELILKRQKVGFYQCAFVADERGDHVMNIRWGKEDIPGSPFCVLVM